MSNLLELYGQLKATEIEKTAETEVESAEIEFLEKYASVADELLTKEVNEGAFADYNEDDVVKLAQLMIEHDAQVDADIEKVAECEQMGVIIGKAIKEELSRA